MLINMYYDPDYYSKIPRLYPGYINGQFRINSVCHAGYKSITRRKK